MMEYTSKYWNMLTPLIKKSLRKRYGKAKTTQLLRKTNQIYRDMLRRADDIGKDNPMASNLYEGLIFLALWDASDRTNLCGGTAYNLRGDDVLPASESHGPDD